jgi:fatty acid desaturase
MQGIDANQGANTGAGRFWRAMIRLGVLVAAGLALLTITLIGLFVVLPLVLVGSVALYLYVRHRLRRVQAAQRPRDGVIDAEYTVVDHRQE